MTSESPDNPDIVAIDSETERIVRDFVRAATSQLSKVLKDQPPEWDLDIRWERDTDGNFRELRHRTRRMWSILDQRWLHTQPDYDAVVARLKTDAIVSPHLDRLVGTCNSLQRIEADDILRSVIYAMLNEQGCLEFTDELFNREWHELTEFLNCNQVPFKTVAPLPYLTLPHFPLHLSDEIALDRLSDEEVTRCCRVGILGEQIKQIPLINGEVAVGIRRTTSLPKLVRTSEEPREPLDAKDEGTFGSRSFLRADLIVDDVLSVLRLFKGTRILTSGHASWTDHSWLHSGISFRVLRQWPYGEKYEISEAEMPKLTELWSLLEKGADQFEFSIRRFNLSFDRGLQSDRIVDLIIAAESLFLRDVGEKYRGELSYRTALRAAKFIEHPTFSETEVFRVMRQAYDARSSVVHGGTMKALRLPDNDSASLRIFIDVVEELVRLGIFKALSMKEDGHKLRESEYWNELVLSKPNEESARS